MKKLICLLLLFFTFFSGKPLEHNTVMLIDPVQDVIIKIKGLNNSVDSLNKILYEKGS